MSPLCQEHLKKILNVQTVSHLFTLKKHLQRIKELARSQPPFALCHQKAIDNETSDVIKDKRNATRLKRKPQRYFAM